MALVITLILLSVTLVMAVAFLAMSRRERSAVTTATDTTTARLAADSALAAAQAEIIAHALATNTGLYDYHLLSSTNFLPGGYNQFTIGRVMPRPIVMMTNLTLRTNESRFYLDLNRNGRDDPASNSLAGDPEWIGVLERPDLPPGSTNKFLARYAFFALPAGNALDLNYIHNTTLNPNLTAASDGFFRNEGVGSWELNLSAFLADLNINEWNGVGSPYYYGRSVGSPNTGKSFEDAFSLLSWRYNANYLTLAPSPFLAENLFNAGLDVYAIGNLMTTVALPAPLSPSTPVSKNWAGSDSTNRFFALPSELFDSARSSANFVSHLTNAINTDSYTFYRMLDQIGTDTTADDSRMNLNYNNLDPYVYTFGGNTYTNAPSETNLIAWTPLGFFTNAANRLLTNYTAIWLAANSSNYVATFGTNTPFGVTGIPVLVSNRFVYTPAVNRLLQLAANIYDATTNNTVALGKNYPSVFRPTFWVTNQGGFNNVYINGYTYVAGVGGPADATYFSSPRDVSYVASVVSGSVDPKVNIYDVPWIIGAKKGFPSFNQFSLVNVASVTRKLEVVRSANGANKFTMPTATNQMYSFSISNVLGCSLWNSYANDFNGNLTVFAQANLNQVLTNSESSSDPLPIYLPQFYNTTAIMVTNFSTTNFTVWPKVGWVSSPPDTQLNSNSFMVALDANVSMFTNAIYRFANPAIGVASPHFDPSMLNYQGGGTPPLPRFYLSTTNQLQVFILDVANGRTNVIDYVHFTQTTTNLDLNAELADPDSANGDPAYMWSTNLIGGVPSGVVNQLAVSGAQTPTPTPAPNRPNFWQAPPGMPASAGNTPDAEKAFFGGFFRGPVGGIYEYNGKRYTNTLLRMQAPYTPTRVIYNYQTWQANDPLVHYLASDLAYSEPHVTGLNHLDDTYLAVIPKVLPLSLKPMIASTHFAPWGGAGWLAALANVETNASRLEFKDTLVWRPDNWDFPTGKLPTPGWLGRVHRGTPWQTVYLKASDVRDIAHGVNTWTNWTGNARLFDATNSAPVSDHALFDLFTTKISDNARYGVLPVNVGSGVTNLDRGLAAWSALFSGVVVLSNSSAGLAPGTTPSIAWFTNSPAGSLGGVSSPVGLMVSNINVLRTNIVNRDGVVGTFEHLGDILRAPLLTEQSPFLNLSDTTGISDELYEWVPQQVMGLLRIPPLPRYVVYCYGQALRPAPNSVYLGGGVNFGMVTNYQVVAESAARAVIRVDKYVVLNTNIITGVVTQVGTNYSTTIESYNVMGPD